MAHSDAERAVRGERDCAAVRALQSQRRRVCRGVGPFTLHRICASRVAPWRLAAESRS